MPAEWHETLRRIFDTNITGHWPVPRGPDWVHAAVDLELQARDVCLMPMTLAAGWQILKAPFFFSQVEGREPRPGGGAQLLHRDMPQAGQSVSLLVFLDDYGPANGATRVAPGTHTGRDAQHEIVLSGEAGDILVFDAALLHGATCNTGGARRRSLLGSYAPESLRHAITPTQTLRNVRMDVSAVFGAARRGRGQTH